MRYRIAAILYLAIYLISTGVAEVLPSPVAPVCQEGDQLELSCNAIGIDHRWEFTVFPENVTHYRLSQHLEPVMYLDL